MLFTKIIKFSELCKPRLYTLIFPAIDSSKRYSDLFSELHLT